MELLGRELWPYWADFGNVDPNPKRTDALVRSAYAIHSTADQGLSGKTDLITFREAELDSRMKELWWTPPRVVAFAITAGIIIVPLGMAVGTFLVK